jgi:hypothetical protein
MLKTRPVVLLLLILGAGVILGILLNNSFTMKTVEAQRIDKSKWEYCRVVYGGSRGDIFGKYVPIVQIEYFQSSGIKKEEIKVDGDGDLYKKAVSQAFAGLGEQGWEMVGLESREGASSSYYFKRSRR